MMFLLSIKNYLMVHFIAAIYGYHGNRKVPFIKITMALPRLIAPAKRLLEQGFNCPGHGQHGFQGYETNVDFEIRSDKEITAFYFCHVYYSMLL